MTEGNPAARLGRRGVLAASLGATALAVGACANEPPTPAPPRTLPHRNVKDFGAVGDGRVDDTEAVARAFAVDGPVAVYFPSGSYAVRAWPEMVEHSTVIGEGGDLSTVLYAGDGPLISIVGKQRIAFRSVGIVATGRTSVCVRLNQAFRCSFESVVLRGQHVSSALKDFLGQTGVILEGDSGGTTFHNCDINNFGHGIVTSCIQNYVTDSRFTTNDIGVLGTGNDFNAGLSLANVEFVSTPEATRYHVHVDGAANNWWMANVWFEGCAVALRIGEPGVGGPSQFGMVNCKVAARDLGLDLRHCRQPYLANVRFDPDRDANSTREIEVNARFCPEGTAIGLISEAGAEIDPAVFPPGWNILGRGNARVAPLTDTVVFAPSERRDLLRGNDPSGDTLFTVDSTGAYISESADAGVVLRSPNGTYWRLTVSDSGEIGGSSLGPARPA